MSWPGLHPGRRRRPRALIVWAAAWTVAAGCAEERAPGEACADCSIHPSGILDPASPDFHGAELARRDWDFELCASCHGDDFAGGASGSSCLECHAVGPTACSTCHAGQPESGAHGAHLGAGPMGLSWPCRECHQVPSRWDDEGHVLRRGAADPPPAEVRFGPAAAQTPPFAVRRAPPGYDASTARCSGVYCHGDVLAGGGGAETRPIWTEPGQAACGSCHGDPPASHADDRCAACHPTTDGAHVDGALPIGDRAGCGGCHGSQASPAPPRDLRGEQTTAALGVGAHQSHLRATARLRGPVACADCHRVPGAIASPGHIDSPSPAEVALIGGGTWDRANAACETWCHGASRPVWTRVAQGEVFCGSCHGIPPADGAHEPGIELGDCAGCHPATVDRFGNILRGGPAGAETSHHMDGDVDL
jgi:predicted CxxxxCH...CXXCH cytochrome family protein